MKVADLEGPLYTWPVLLAALVVAETEHPGERLNTTQVMMRAYELAHGCVTVHLGQVSRTLDRMADAQLVESERVRERGSVESVVWSLTERGRVRFSEIADVLAHVARIVPKTPRKAPRK